MEDILNLDVCSDGSFDASVWKDIKYPCLFIDGITSEEELRFFKESSKGSDASLPLYCNVENIPLEVGSMELELHALLALKGIFDYKLALYKSADQRIPLDLNDPNVLIKFIRL